MDYDFRNNRTNPPPYTSQSQMYNRPPSSTSSSSTHPMYAPPPPSSLYPKVGQSAHPVNAPPSRAPPFHPAPSPPASSGIGIRVTLNPKYRITPPPQMSPHVGDIPRSTFQFDFDLERKILAEAEKENPNWSKLGLENLPSRPVESTSSVGPTTDPVVSKYMASGLSREAVPLAVAHYGDNPTKNIDPHTVCPFWLSMLALMISYAIVVDVEFHPHPSLQVREFGIAYTHLREMGFRSNNVAEALLMYDNDTNKALAYLLNN